jgi:hypothetical protein
MFKMFSMGFNARLRGMSYHGFPSAFKDAETVADSLIGIHNAMVKCLFVANMSCINKEFLVSRGKIPED